MFTELGNHQIFRFYVSIRALLHHLPWSTLTKKTSWKQVPILVATKVLHENARWNKKKLRVLIWQLVNFKISMNMSFICLRYQCICPSFSNRKYPFPWTCFEPPPVGQETKGWIDGKGGGSKSFKKKKALFPGWGLPFWGGIPFKFSMDFGPSTWFF